MVLKKIKKITLDQHSAKQMALGKKLKKEHNVEVNRLETKYASV
ncbi:hypothetical protein LCGC14_2235600, partial [marine sediment metagenome]